MKMTPEIQNILGYLKARKRLLDERKLNSDYSNVHLLNDIIRYIEINHKEEGDSNV